MSSPYLLYTEYYIISGAYFIVDVINGALTYSAHYSDNFKGYLHSKVASKQFALNEFIRSQNDLKINDNLNDNDVDEDGFVVIKPRRSKKNKTNSNDNNNSNDTTTNQNLDQNVNMDQIKGFTCVNSDSDIIEQVVEDMIKDVIKRLYSHENITN